MNNVFPFKEDCGKIQVSSDWEAEWYMLTKRLEIAQLSIEGIQAWIITSGRQCQMGTTAPNLSIWTPWDSHEESHIGSTCYLCFPGKLRAGRSLCRASRRIYPDTHHKSTIPAPESIQIMCATLRCNQMWCQPFQNLFPCLQRALSGSSLPYCST